MLIASHLQNTLPLSTIEASHLSASASILTTDTTFLSSVHVPHKSRSHRALRAATNSLPETDRNQSETNNSFAVIARREYERVGLEAMTELLRAVTLQILGSPSPHSTNEEVVVDEEPQVELFTQSN